MEIRNLENVIFPSSVEPCRILHLFRRILQIISAKITKFCGFLQNSAEFRRIVFVPQNCSVELQSVIGQLLICRIPQNSAEPRWLLLQNSAEWIYNTKSRRRVLRNQTRPQNFAKEICSVPQTSAEYYYVLYFRRIVLWNKNHWYWYWFLPYYIICQVIFTLK